MNFIKRIKDISIRGRLAYGIMCIEKALEKEGITDTRMNSVLDKIWDFTSQTDLRTWRIEAIEINPPFILEDGGLDENAEFVTISINEAKELKDLYLSIPKYLLELIEDVIWLGVSDILSSVRGHSSKTLIYLMDVIDIMNDNNVNLPNISRFEESSFEEDGGWGNIVTKDFFYA